MCVYDPDGEKLFLDVDYLYHEFCYKNGEIKKKPKIKEILDGYYCRPDSYDDRTGKFTNGEAVYLYTDNPEYIAFKKELKNLKNKIEQNLSDIQKFNNN